MHYEGPSIGLVLELGVSCWTMCSVLEASQDSSTALQIPFELTTVCTLKMREWSVSCQVRQFKINDLVYGFT